MEKTLRQYCLQSKRLNQLSENEFALYKKEIGSIELQELEEYFVAIVRRKLKVKNECGSLVAYLIGIADKKPTNSLIYKGGILPDIDIDFADNRREEVIEYLSEKYGADHVAGIGTFGYMWARNAVRLAGKALGHEQSIIDQTAKLIPEISQGKNWHIDEALKESKQLRDSCKADKRIEEIIRWAGEIDGSINNRSQHAAGIVLSNDPIYDLGPVWRNSNNFPVLEFVGDEAEELGLVKFDFLGLRTLTIMSDAIKLINERHNQKLSIDEIPMDDPKTYELFATGKLLGIFQLEGSGISGYTKRYQPKDLMDVAFISAGYRPGPIQFIHDILKIRHGLTWEKTQPTSELYPLIADILKETQGYFIYQEQIQKVTQVLAGYSDSEAVDFMKTIAKKLPEKMPKEKKRFTAKALEKGMTIKQIDGLWKQMESFAAYCFNKSHAVAYSMITVQTAWIKTHYPAEFYAACIINEIATQEKVTAYMHEAKEFGISVLPPDINESETKFAVINDKTIRFGIGGIANVGVSTADILVAERRANGPFTSVSNFIYRTNARSNILTNAIKAGCFDRFAFRSQYLFDYTEDENYIDRLSSYIRYFRDKQLIPLDNKGEWLTLPLVGEYSKLQLAKLEKDMNGLYLQYNPMKILESQINRIRRESPGILIGYPSELMIFRSGKGCTFQLNTDDMTTYKMLIVGKSWGKLKDRIKFFMDDIVCLEGNMVKDDVVFSNNISYLKNRFKDTSIEYSIPIPLTLGSMNHFGDITKDIKGSDNEITFFLDLMGKNYKKQVYLGNNN